MASPRRWRTSAGWAKTARSVCDRSDSAASNSSGPALRAWFAASRSTSRLGGSSTSEDASSRVAPDRRHALDEAARTAVRRYDWSAVAEQILRVYETVVAGVV